MKNKVKKPVRKGAAKVAVVMQMEALECGAACLTMVLAYYGKWLPLEQVRADCGVSRDGSNAANVLKAARRYGLTAKGYRFEPEDLRREGKFPCMIHWNFNHFVVLNGFSRNHALINDPGRGFLKVPMAEFDKAFTGICLLFESGEDFKPGGKAKSVMAFAKARLRGSAPMFAFIILTTVISAIIGVLQPAMSQIFTDVLLTGKNPGWLLPFCAVLLGLAAVRIIVGALEATYLLKLEGKFAIPKLKLSGSERRAFSIWAENYTKRAKLIYSPPFLVKFSRILTLLVSSLGMVIMYYCAVQSRVSMPDYMAFHAAYGQVSGAFAALTGTALAIANIAQQFNFMKPLFEALPETGEGKKIVTSLSGGFEVNNVSFRYSETMPIVLDDISLKIRPGQYVAIVGETGCGKSTLLRILLGFETPQKGSVYYDGQDISTLDLKSLRRNIGVVTQDGKLFQGDVFSNIVISAPQLTMDDAWEAAELAGIADDIRAMPMGMHTIISEGGGGISGGQKQRLMIARAIAPKPKLLMLDEATSALDNITQKHVSDALAELKCTRIVIAHRLSTIKQAGRIIVLAGGKIVEDGTYEGLMEQNGIFADLVGRQMVTKNEK